METLSGNVEKISDKGWAETVEMGKQINKMRYQQTANIQIWVWRKKPKIPE